jgi:hypothetical protein
LAGGEFFIFKGLNLNIIPIYIKLIFGVFLLVNLSPLLYSQEEKEVKKPKVPDSQETVKCGKITYSKSKTSVCFSDFFLSEINSKTSIKTDNQFNPVKLDSDEIFNYPFCVISGEDSFTLTEKEKANLKRYLLNGGFILASPGCSNAEWNKSFRQALASIFPDKKLRKLDMSHPIFSVFYKIDKLTLKNGGTTQIEGLEIDGRIALVYSMEGLNDVANAKGCCCCGGNEIKECQQVNINIFLYAMLF